MCWDPKMDEATSKRLSKLNEGNGLMRKLTKKKPAIAVADMQLPACSSQHVPSLAECMPPVSIFD